MSVKLQINMTNQYNENIKENIGYVNPSATDAQLYELATKFCSLTTNTFVSVDKIVTTAIEGDDNG